MVVTSDVVLIARAAKKSLDSLNIRPQIRGTIKEILNYIEYIPSHPKSKIEMDYCVLETLVFSAETQEEKEILKKARRIVYRADLNAQMRELGPEEVDLEEEEEESSKRLSKSTDVNQELIAVRKDFEEYKAKNDAKLEALEQKMAQMVLGSEVVQAQEPGSLEDFDMSNFGSEDGDSAPQSQNFVALKLADLEGALYSDTLQISERDQAEVHRFSALLTELQEPSSPAPRIHKLSDSAPEHQEPLTQKIADLEAALQSKTSQISKMKQEHEETVRRMNQQLHDVHMHYQLKVLQNPQMRNQLETEGLEKRNTELQSKTELQTQKIRRLEAMVGVRDSFWIPKIKDGEDAEENSSLRSRLEHFKSMSEALKLQVSDLTEEKDRLEEKLRMEKEIVRELRKMVRAPVSIKTPQERRMEFMRYLQDQMKKPKESFEAQAREFMAHEASQRHPTTKKQEKQIKEFVEQMSKNAEQEIDKEFVEAQARYFQQIFGSI